MIKIITWNMLFKNKELDRAYEFLLKENADIICIQETPKKFLEMLKKTNYNIFYGINTTIKPNMITKGKEKLYNVILSKHEIINSKEYLIINNLKNKLRTNIFITFMIPFGWEHTNPKSNSIYTDIKVNNKIIRVSCTKLKLVSGVSERLKQFNIVLSNTSKKHRNIICGDFNIVENKLIKPFTWFIGSTFKEIFLQSERKIFQEKFRKFNLKNPFLGNTTIPAMKNQSDHILVPENMRVISKKVCIDSYGSDHYPLILEVEIV